MRRRYWLSTPLGHYVDRNSVIHRLSPTKKIVFITLFIVLVTIESRQIGGSLSVLNVGALGIEAMVILVIFVLAHIPLRVVISHMLSTLPILLPVSALQLWSTGWQASLSLTVSLLVSMSLAILFTLTTRISDMIESIHRNLRPLERFHVPVEEISTALALTVCLIPRQQEAIHRAIDARRARSARGLRAVILPIAIHSIRQADVLGDALASRGFDD